MLASPCFYRDEGLRYMKSIQRNAGGERISALSRDTRSEAPVDPPVIWVICGVKVKDCTVELAGEAHLAR